MSTTNTPNDPLDQVLIQFSTMQKDFNALSDRLRETEKTTAATLKTMAKAETYFDLRVQKAVHQILSMFLHQLEHNITDNMENFKAIERGFEIRVVDGINEQENSETILVTRHADGAFEFAAARSPEKIQNENMEPFAKWLGDHPELFDGQDQILINVLVTVPVAELEAERAMHEQVNQPV